MPRLMQYIMMAAARSFSANSRIDPSGSNLTFTRYWAALHQSQIFNEVLGQAAAGLVTVLAEKVHDLISVETRMRDWVGTPLLPAILNPWVQPMH